MNTIRNNTRFLTRTLPLAVVLLACLAIAGLSLARTFQQATPGYTYQFPRDHASHNDFKTEWWYYTGHLNAADGKRYGYELTFFRSGVDDDNAPRNTAWKLDNLYLAHFAVTDEAGKRFLFTEKLNRGAMGVAGARDDVYNVWNETWLAEQLGNRMLLRAESPEFDIHLLLTPEKPPVIHGRNGISQKATCEGCASHYYSMTRLQTEGMLYREGKPVPVKGLSWMDHEFGSNQLAREQTGWDWFSLQLDNGEDVMLYLLRHEDGRIDPNSSGTYVDRNGRARHLDLKDFQITVLDRWTSPKTGGNYPIRWRVEIPSETLSVEVSPVFPEQELVTTQSTGVTYWEGSSTVRGQKKGRPVKGQAYVEMTGYAEQFRQRI